MDTICLDCTKYDTSDQLARLFAVISQAPYLAILHVISVCLCCLHVTRMSSSNYSIQGVCLNVHDNE